MQITFPILVRAMVIIVFTFLLVALISVVIQFFKKKDRYLHGPRLIYVCGVGGLFALLIAALSILLEGSFNGELAKGVDVSMVTLCISVSAIIPFLVTKALTEMEVTKKVNENIDDKIKETRERLEQAASAAEGKISIYDSDLSRMISFLMIQKTPDRIWSMSWACRSLKSMINAKLVNSETCDREYNDLYVAQCISFITSSLEELCCIDNIEEFFKKYDDTFESFYTMGLKTGDTTPKTGDTTPVKGKISENDTLLRLFRDMLTLYGQLEKSKTKRKLFDSGIFSGDKDPKYIRLKHLASWFIFSLAKHHNYLQKDPVSTIELPEEFVKKSYVLSKESSTELQNAFDRAVDSYLGQFKQQKPGKTPLFPRIPDSGIVKESQDTSSLTKVSTSKQVRKRRITNITRNKQ